MADEDTAPTTAELDNQAFMAQAGNCDSAAAVEDMDLADGETAMRSFDITTKPQIKLPSFMMVLILTPLTFGLFLLYYIYLAQCKAPPKGGTKAKLIVTNKMRIVLWQLKVQQDKKNPSIKKHAVDVKFYNISDLCYINFTFDKEPRLCMKPSFAATLRLYFGKYPTQSTVTAHAYKTMDNPFNTMITMTGSMDKSGLRLRFLAETIIQGATAAKGMFGTLFGAAAKGPGMLVGAAVGKAPKSDDPKAALHTLGSIADPSVQFSVDGTCPSYMEITCDAEDSQYGGKQPNPVAAFEKLIDLQKVICSARGAQHGLAPIEGKGKEALTDQPKEYTPLVDAVKNTISLSKSYFPVGQFETITAVFPEAHIITCMEYVLTLLTLGLYYFLFVKPKLEDKGVLVSTTCRVCQLYTRGNAKEGPASGDNFCYQMNMYFVHKVQAGMISFDPSRQSYMELQTTCGCLKISPIVRKSQGDTAVNRLKEFFQVMTAGACKGMVEKGQIAPSPTLAGLVENRNVEQAGKGTFAIMFEDGMLLPNEEMLCYLPNKPLEEGKGCMARMCSCGIKPIGLSQELVLTNKRLLAGSKKKSMREPYCASCTLDESWVFVWVDMDATEFIGLSMTGIVQKVPALCCGIDSSFAASVVEVAMLDSYPVCVQNYKSASQSRNENEDELRGFLEEDEYLKPFRKMYSQLMVARQDKFFNRPEVGDVVLTDHRGMMPADKV